MGYRRVPEPPANTMPFIFCKVYRLSVKGYRNYLIRHFVSNFYFKRADKTEEVRGQMEDVILHHMMIIPPGLTDTFGEEKTNAE